MLKVNLFFDESGKNDDAVKTMGSLMIPEKVYNCKEIVALNERLRKEEFELHWTKYNGGNSEAKIYKEIVEAFSKYLSLCEFNILLKACIKSYVPFLFPSLPMKTISFFLFSCCFSSR